MADESSTVPAPPSLDLWRSAPHLAGIISICADAIISLDGNHRIALFNEGAERLFGWKAAEVMGQPLDLLLPERYRAIHRHHVTAFASSAVRSTLMGEGRPSIVALHRDGHEFPAEASISHLVVDGTHTLTVVLRDISARRRAEDEQRFLADVGARLATTLDREEMIDVVARLGLEYFADACAVDLFEPSGALRRCAVVHSDPAKADSARVSALAPLDPARPDVVWAVLRDRKTVTVPEVAPEYLESVAVDERHLEALRLLGPRSLLCAPVLAPDRLLGAITFFSSRPRRYGPDDVRMAEELVRRAALALENARLYRASREATRSRDDVLGIVAHDLRTPLSGVRMLTRRLLDKLKADQGSAYEYASEIGRACARMDRLIQQLLDVTRIEASALSLALRPVPARQLLDEAASCVPMVEAAGLRWELDAPAELPVVLADPDRIHQVFTNLLDNVAKFAGSGSVILSARTLEDGMLELSVEDEGPGLAPEQVEHLFDRFWQAQRADRRGAGLGLAIVKGIVEGHRGRISVQSELGHGTRIAFTLCPAGRSESLGTAPAEARRRER